jgi:hypothetical protein
MEQPMAQKEVFVEITRACWVYGVQVGVGSIVKMKENDANMCKGLGKAKDSEAKAEKLVAFKKPEAKSEKAGK